MFAMFKKRACKLLAELAELRRKEVSLAQRAQEHIKEAYDVIDACFDQIDGAQLVIDEIEGGRY